MSAVTDVLTALLVAISVPMLLVGIAELAYFPLAMLFERRARRMPVFSEPVPVVSVVVPAYNEGRVLANCVESVLRDIYPRKQVVLVDDGSTDDTLAIMRRYEHLPNVVVLTQANAGKAAALNTGLRVAAGEILMFVDADGVFTSTTIEDTLLGFDSAMVGAVCGNDEPVNLDRVQTRLLALLTHGTAFVRRSLALINCLTIVSGNMGAFRRSVLQRTGGFTPGLVGEDLELTWRVHRAGFRVNFRPRALVYAEVPSTLRALWKQRVRWTRGHVQTLRMHSDMLFRRRYAPASYYLPLNVFTMLVAPVLQVTALLLVGVLSALGDPPVSGSVVGVVLWLGFGFAIVSTGFALYLDKAWRDLRFAYVLPLWPVFSLLMSAVVIYAIAQELRGAPARWNKFARTGVVSRRDVALPGAAGDPSGGHGDPSGGHGDPSGGHGDPRPDRAAPRPDRAAPRPDLAGPGPGRAGARAADRLADPVGDRAAASPALRSPLLGDRVPSPRPRSVPASSLPPWLRPGYRDLPHAPGSNGGGRHRAARVPRARGPVGRDPEADDAGALLDEWFGDLTRGR